MKYERYISHVAIIDSCSIIDYRSHPSSAEKLSLFLPIYPMENYRGRKTRCERIRRKTNENLFLCERLLNK